MQQHSNRIGDMNGGWALLLRIGLATYPVVLISLLSWATWATASIMRHEAQLGLGPRFTQSAASALESRAAAYTDLRARSVETVLSAKLDALQSILTEVRLKTVRIEERTRPPNE